MSAGTGHQDIPKSVLDQAFHWAVTLNSGTATTADHQAFAAWLDKDSRHRIAWQRIQMIEQEFIAARPAAISGSHALERIVRQRRHKRRVAAGLGSLLSALILVGLLLGLTPMRYQWQAQHATDIGEQRQIVLPGGAQLYLNSRTAVDVSSTAQGPLIRLYQGEILVDSSAAPIEDKPRVVSADARLTPIGTRFVVQTRDGATDLAVTEGLVLLEPIDGGRTAQVKADERWRVAHGRASLLAPFGLRAGAWTEGIIEADDARLGDVLDAIGKQRYGWLNYDAAAANLRVTGIFRLDDTDNALQALARSLPIRIERTTDWWVTVKARE